MAIIADYNDPANSLNKAFLKITRIWGSKEEGWAAWVSVFKNQGDQESVTMFSVMAPYEDDVNPFTALYSQIAKLSFIKNAYHDTSKERMSIPEPTEVPKLETVAETPKKKSRSRKNSA